MSSPEICLDGGSPASKRPRIVTYDDATAGPSGCITEESLPGSILANDVLEGFKTETSNLKGNPPELEKSERENYSSLCSLSDFFVAGISTPTILQDSANADSVLDSVGKDNSELVASISRPVSLEFAKPLPFFPNDHFDDISDSQLLKLENEAVNNSLKTSSVQPASGRWTQFPPSTMWVRKNLILKRSLISAIKEVESMTRHVKQLTKELQENAVTSN